MPSEGFEYYVGTYWNDFPEVVARLNERATGDRGVDWMAHLRQVYGPFENALVVNCGTGWVERQLVEKGVIRGGVGFDVSEDLVETARDCARRDGLPLEYVRLDANRDPLPSGDFDVVVNHAALHHVAWLDKVLRDVCHLLGPEGVLVSWDYTGPHRNQYPAFQWEQAWRLNQSLPADVRQDLRYPHLPTMLADDPTEAVHSELIVDHIDRYFDIEHHRNLGGGLAYLILTHNEAMQTATRAQVDSAVAAVMDADAVFTAEHPEANLFSYLVCRPRHDTLGDTAQLAAWTEQERSRERRAADAGGRYYSPTVIGHLTEELTRLTERVQALESVDHDAERDLDATLATIPGPALARTLLRRLLARIANLRPRRGRP